MKNLVKGALIGVAIIVTGGAAVMVYNVLILVLREKGGSFREIL